MSNFVKKNDIAEELLDVVDEKNQVINQRPRKEIHIKHLRHRSAHILIYNQKGDLFLQKRSISKDDFPGYWDSSAAGHVEAGESYDQCIKREVQEELGVVLSGIPEKLFMLEAVPGNGMEFCQVYRTLHEGPFVLEEDEIDEGRWFSEQEISDWLLSGGNGLTESVKVMAVKIIENF